MQDRSAELRRLGATAVELAQVSLRLDAREALGPHPVHPPTVPNTWTTIAGRELLWLGPNEWLATGPPGTERDLARWLDDAFAQLDRSVVDVSASRAVLEMQGDARHERLACGCGLDLHPRSWRAGSCAQTLLARIPVILQERETSTRVFLRPSFSGYLVDWLLAASA